MSIHKDFCLLIPCAGSYTKMYRALLITRWRRSSCRCRDLSVVDRPRFSKYRLSRCRRLLSAFTKFFPYSDGLHSNLKFQHNLFEVFVSTFNQKTQPGFFKYGDFWGIWLWQAASLHFILNVILIKFSFKYLICQRSLTLIGPDHP